MPVAMSRALISSRTWPNTRPGSCCATRYSICRSDLRAVPWCTFSDPELARVGMSESEANEKNIAHRVYRFSFEEIDRAQTARETAGFVKVLTAREADCSERLSSGRMQAS
jgi:pyruvate/2-oxoglutarate dehydrogenase complex dihydrolipoamide dehydrogenase (E3) component